MTAKQMEDWFLADDLEAVSPLMAEMVRTASSHEEVEEVIERVRRILENIGAFDQ